MTPPKLNDYQAMCQEFHVAFDLPRGDYAKPVLSRAVFRAELICEESRETINALRRGDLVETIDGLADIAYVTFGAGVEFGVEITPWVWPHFRPKHAPKVGDVPELRYQFMLSGLVARQSAETQMRLVDQDIEGGLQLAKAYLHPAMCQLTRLAATTFFVAGQLGVDLDPFFREVHRTNMAKVGGPIRADGKRLKPPGWTPPRIREMLVERGWTPPLDTFTEKAA